MQFILDQAVEILSRTPATLRSLLSGLSEPWVNNRYGEATFSPFDVVGHLLSGERRDWIPRLRIILEDGESRPFDPFNRFGMYEESRGKTLAELLDSFERLRQENVAALQSSGLTEDKLSRRGTHPDLGPVTARQLIATWVVHDLGHLAQIARAMAFQYGEQVGPWKQYLSILPREEPK